ESCARTSETASSMITSGVKRKARVRSKAQSSTSSSMPGWPNGVEKGDVVASRKTISVMTPCFNEEDGIRECYERVRQVFEQQLPEYNREHLFIDNCSTDRTVAILKEIAANDKHVKIIVNARNFGLSRSPYHGMLQVTGDAVVPVVAD